MICCENVIKVIFFLITDFFFLISDTKRKKTLHKLLFVLPYLGVVYEPCLPFLHFFFQRLLQCSWDMNSAFRLMNSNSHCSCTQITLCRRHCALFTEPTPTLFRKNIKNGSHSTIYTFKNYFATVFSVFSFQRNKLYSNESKVSNFSIFLPCTSKP